MIKTVLKQNNDQIVAIHVSGHAMHAKHGTDIVCASVSTAIIVTINALEHLHLHSNIEFELRDGYFDLKVIENNDILQKLLKKSNVFI